MMQNVMDWWYGLGWWGFVLVDVIFLALVAATQLAAAKARSLRKEGGGWSPRAIGQGVLTAGVSILTVGAAAFAGWLLAQRWP